MPQETKVASTLDWFITLWLLTIPIVNLILLIVWAFGGTASQSKANFAKATLLWMFGVVLILIPFMILSGVAGLLFGA